MPQRNCAMEVPGLHVAVDTDLCDEIGRCHRLIGLSGVVIGACGGASTLRLDEESAERWYQDRLALWEEDQRSIWSALRAMPKPERLTEMMIFSGVLKVA